MDRVLDQIRAENTDCDCLSLASEVLTEFLLTLNQVDKQFFSDLAAFCGKAYRKVADTELSIVFVRLEKKS